MPVPDTSQDGLTAITKAEHGSDAKSKRVTLRQFIPGTGEWANISAIDNGDGTYSLKTSGTISVSQPTTSAVTSVGDTATSTQLIASNSLRKEVEFYNGSSAILYLLKGAGTASASNYTVQMNQGDYYTTSFTGACQGIWASDAGGTVLVTEST